MKFLNGACLGFVLGLGTMAWLTVPAPPDLHICVPAPVVLRGESRPKYVCYPVSKVPGYNRQKHIPKATIDKDICWEAPGSDQKYEVFEQ